jgi:hypothetical protein
MNARAAIAEDQVHVLEHRKLPLAMSERAIRFLIHFVSHSSFGRSAPESVTEADSKFTDEPGRK